VECCWPEDHDRDPRSRAGDVVIWLSLAAAGAAFSGRRMLLCRAWGVVPGVGHLERTFFDIFVKIARELWYINSYWRRKW